MEYLRRIMAYIDYIRQHHGRLPAAGLLGLIVFALVAALSGILALMGLLLWVSPYLGALFALLIMIVLSV